MSSRLTKKLLKAKVAAPVGTSKQLQAKKNNKKRKKPENFLEKAAKEKAAADFTAHNIKVMKYSTKRTKNNEDLMNSLLKKMSGKQETYDSFSDDEDY
jgi:hypothetical protein